MKKYIDVDKVKEFLDCENRGKSGYLILEQIEEKSWKEFNEK